jgi:hypothetical protein
MLGANRRFDAFTRKTIASKAGTFPFWALFGTVNQRMPRATVNEKDDAAGRIIRAFRWATSAAVNRRIEQSHPTLSARYLLRRPSAISPEAKAFYLAL